MAQYDDYYTYFVPVQTPLMGRAAHRGGGDAVQRRMLIILAAVSMLIPLFFVALKPRNLAGASSVQPLAAAAGVAAAAEVVAGAEAGEAAVAGAEETQLQLGQAAPEVTAGIISPVFTREVQQWAPQIGQWANTYGLDPNLVAIIMQIESCGDPQAVSHAGAQGLFQVMPFHFAAGENALDPDTNAYRGLSYYVDRLAQTNGDVGRAFAGYNGGQRAAASSWDSWPNETQRYYRWSTGIYQDILNGVDESPTVQAWLQAGGASLCSQAASRLGLQ